MILKDALYHTEEIKHLLPFTDHSLRKARREGLKVTYYCNHGYVLGQDLINFLENIAPEKQTNEDQC